MKQINFRVKEQQYEKLKKEAEKSNFKTVTSFCKNICINKKVKIFKDYSIYKNLIKEINKIGNNINQIARYCNTAKEVDKNVLEELKKINEQLQKMLQNN